LHIEGTGTAEHRVDNHLARGLCHSLGDINRSLAWRCSPAFGLPHRNRAECRDQSKQLVVSEGGRDSAPLPFPIRTFRHEQRGGAEHR
jgi:hypothetical protein